MVLQRFDGSCKLIDFLVEDALPFAVDFRYIFLLIFVILSSFAFSKLIFFCQFIKQKFILEFILILRFGNDLFLKQDVIEFESLDLFLVEFSERCLHMSIITVNYNDISWLN